MCLSLMLSILSNYYKHTESIPVVYYHYKQVPYLLDQTLLLSSRRSQIVASTSHVFSEIDAALK